MANVDGASDQIASQLIAYLSDELSTVGLDYAAPLTQLHGGYETATYRFQLNVVSDELAQPLVLRLYPQYFGAHNAVWESTVQNVLASEGYPVAKVYFTCTDLSILGGAFFIMEFLPGEPLIKAPLENMIALLGQAHAALHQIDPRTLSQKLAAQNIAAHRYRMNGRFKWLRDRANKLPWLAESVNWLVANRPAEPERLAICHGDFHPLNILVQAGHVSGVLDWPGFLIADPAYDVANTMVLTTIPVKQIAPALVNHAAVDWEMVAQRYLDAYRAHRPLSSEHLAYYRVRRCVDALIQGFDGQKVWQHPVIVEDLRDYIRQTTGITIPMPI